MTKEAPVVLTALALAALWLLPVSGGNVQAQGQSGFIAQGVVYEPQIADVQAVVPYNEKGIVADGVIDEQEWFAASAFTGFTNNTTRSYAASQTVVYACYDEEHLNLAFVTDALKGGEKLVIALKPLDTVHVLSIDAQGTLNALPPNSLRRDIEWKSGSKDGRWVCEMRLPYEAFAAGKPNNDRWWRANFARTFVAPYAETSWAHKLIDDPASFPEGELGQLIFRTETPYLKILSLGPIDQKRMRIRGSLFEKASGDPAKGARKELFFSFPFITRGKKRAISHSLYYNAGETTLINVTSGPTMDYDKLVYPWREADSLFFTISQAWGGPVLLHTSRYAVGPSFDSLYLHSYKAVPDDVFMTWFETLGIRPADVGKLKLEARMTSPTGKLIGERSVDSIGLGSVGLEFKTSALGYGENTLLAVLKRGNGEEAARVEKKIEKPDPAQWRGNKIGISGKVPAPFQPVRSRGDSVFIWGREYVLKQGVLAQVVTRGQGVLAAPINFEGVSGGRKLIFTASPWRFESLRDTAAVAKCTLTSAALDIEVRQTIEFDGMSRVDLRLLPKGGEPVDSLALTIPLKAEHARYLNWTRSIGNGDRSMWGYGAVPDEGFKGDFRPFVWLGDEDRGLLWFAENMKNWNVGEKDQVLQVYREGAQVALQVRMIDRPTRLSQPAAITFGLQATPVRPRPERWREFTKKIEIYSSNNFEATTYNPKVVQTDAKELAEIIAKGRKPVLYAYPRWVNTLVPAYIFSASEWRAGGPLNRDKQDGYDLDNMSSKTGFTEFNIWAEKLALDKAPHRHSGLLYDLSWNGPSTNPLSAYKDSDGVEQPSWDIFALREYYKRIYTLFRQRMKQTYIVGHSSANTIQTPIYSFCDGTWDGEQHAYWVRDYISEVPLDKWRAEFTHRQFGTVPIFLASLRYFEPGEAETKANLTLATMVYLHDTMLMSHDHYKPEVFAPFEKVKDEFGIADNEVRYLPYWESNGSTFVTGDSRVLVSGYTRPGRALLVVGNLDESEKHPDIFVDFRALGITPRSVRIHDGRTARAGRLVNGRIRVDIRGKSPVFVTIN